ncbi:MAG TPA: DNA polymerase IV [Candidatus Omnitrophota bacterium]|nr:DNA polymerase IV [Candidatus Omnitrophota bacterium]HRZ67687.1 DNA polymerase IV [Candidatus Omnitrophota bacterium]
MDRTIMHIDMDAFFASIEQASDPRLRGKPVIVGGKANKQRTVVCAASYEAKRMGIDSAMSVAEAFRICPQAEFVVADTAKYVFTSHAIFDMLKPYSPRVEQASVDEFWLDMTGTERFLGPVEEVARRIKERIRSEFGVTASVGISSSRLFAKVASKLKKPDGLVVLDKADIAETLKEMPVGKITGIGKSTRERLNGFGIFVYSDMARFDMDFYREKFGKFGLWLYGVSRGEDGLFIPSWQAEDAPPKSVGHSYTLPYNAQNPELIEAWLRLLCEMVASRLRSLGLEGRCLHVFLRQPDMGCVAKQKMFAVPTSDGAEIFTRAMAVIGAAAAGGRMKGFRMRALGVCASALTPACGSRLLEEDIKRRDLIKSVDEINGRFGEWTVYPARVSGLRPT